MTVRFSTGLRNKNAGISINKISNGDFSTDTTGWTAVTAALTAAASGQAGLCLQVAESGGAAVGQAYQDITTKVGHLYRFTGYFKKGTADAGRFLIGTAGAIWDSGALTDATWVTATNPYIKYFLATASTTRITCQTDDTTAGETSLFDTLSLVSLAASYKDLFAGGFIDVYTGLQPASADTAPSGTIIATFSNGGAGITFDDAASGVLSKAVAEAWAATVVSPGGTAGWFRLRTVGDLGTTNSTDERIDGAIGISGSDMNFPNGVSWAINSVQTLSTFTITLPAA